MITRLLSTSLALVLGTLAVQAAPPPCSDAWAVAVRAMDSGVPLSRRLKDIEAALLACADAPTARRALLYQNRGDTLEQQGRLDDARKSYQRALELDPGLLVASLSLGDLAFARQDCKEACRRYIHALGFATDPDPTAVQRVRTCHCYDGAKGVDFARDLKAEAADFGARLDEHVRAKGMLAGSLAKGAQSPLRYRVFFPFNARGVSDVVGDLGQLARQLRSRSPELLGVVVGGHGDDVGTDAQNQMVSRERAEAVHRFLIAQGVPGKLLTVDWHGRGRPVASNATEEGRWLNRRVELTITPR